MTDHEAKVFIDDSFRLIKSARTIIDIDNIYDKMKIPVKNIMDSNTYPKIDFKIEKQEIDLLIERNIIDKDFNFSKDFSDSIEDPLTKLLYATVWKNGDLKKVKHIIKGVKNSGDKNNQPDEALVFNQFGKYLTKEQGEPIIDQHVIRAFAVYAPDDNHTIKELQKLGGVNQKYKMYIPRYKKWLTELPTDLQNEKDYVYHIDRLLFALGKTIKMTKEK